jgi:hypothetical protein
MSDKQFLDTLSKTASAFDQKQQPDDLISSLLAQTSTRKRLPKGSPD